MSDYRRLFVRFIGMFLVIVWLAGCTALPFAPGGKPSNVSTAIWESLATQTAQGTPVTFPTAASGTRAVSTPQPTIAGGSAYATAGYPTPGAAITPVSGATQLVPATPNALVTGALAPTAQPPVGTLGALGTPAGAAAGVPPIASIAQQWLATQLNQPLAQVVIQNFQHVQWPDACLGLPQAGQMCAQVITPGWRIIFYANGQVYEVRVDDAGRVFRMVQGGKG